MWEMWMKAWGRLLIVDDESGIVEVLKKILKEKAGEIETASNGAEALDKIKAGGFDAVLSDIHMPVMDGLELLARVRTLQVQTPFVFLSGYGDQEKTRRALRLGATDFLDKPFEPEVLLDTVGKALELGLSMRAAETELESLYSSADLPEETKVRLRKMKQAILMMRYTGAIYKK
jgi:YesN/AraC family two-component response regulator